MMIGVHRISAQIILSLPSISIPLELIEFRVGHHRRNPLCTFVTRRTSIIFIILILSLVVKPRSEIVFDLLHTWYSL